MRAHSIESRIIHEKELLRVNNGAPEICNSVCNFYPKQQKDFKPMSRRCQSASALAKRPKSNPNNSTQRLTQLQLKYRNLEIDYRRVLEEVRSQTELFCKQKDEIQKLSKMTQKQEKQIFQLKQLLKMTEKKSIALQTEQKDELSYRKRIEASTGESQLTSQTRCDRISQRKKSESKQRSLYRKNIEKQKLADSRMLRKNGVNTNNGKEKAPLTKKYKFIPTLNFRQN